MKIFITFFSGPYPQIHCFIGKFLILKIAFPFSSRISTRGIRCDDEILRQILGDKPANGSGSSSGGVTPAATNTPTLTMEEKVNNFIRQRIDAGKAEKELERQRKLKEEEDQRKREEGIEEEEEETAEDAEQEDELNKSMAESIQSEVSDIFAEGRPVRAPSEDGDQRTGLQKMIDEIEEENRRASGSGTPSPGEQTEEDIGSEGEGEKTPVVADGFSQDSTAAVLKGAAKKVARQQREADNNNIPYLSGRGAINRLAPARSGEYG